mmetsp:Transcript_9007/g.25310  ORF Transcript_9007/g.25310 Transcript_9007/m.25310 type:complete len:232 (+) Transcript_9007:2170-2865(+)
MQPGLGTGHTNRPSLGNGLLAGQDGILVDAGDGNEGPAAGHARQGLEEAGAAHQVDVALLRGREAADGLDGILPCQPHRAGLPELLHVLDRPVGTHLACHDLGRFHHGPSDKVQDEAVSRHRLAAIGLLGVVGQQPRSGHLELGDRQGCEDVRDEALLGIVLEVGHRGGFGQRTEDGTCRRRRWRRRRGLLLLLLLMRILRGTILSKGMLMHLVLRLRQCCGLLLGQGSYH